MQGRGGIYRIKNLLDGKIYVGCSVDAKRRIYLHKRMLRMGNHDNIHLQRAWSRDGEENFTFRVIERVANPANLLAREKHWIDAYECLTTGYNLCAEGASQLGRHQTEYQKQTLSKFHQGKPKSAETRRKRSLAALGKKKSPEHRAKIAEATRLAMQDPARRAASSRGGHTTAKLGIHFGNKYACKDYRSKNKKS